MKFELMKPSEVAWDDLDRFEDRNVFQTREWVDFLVDTQHGEPVVARLVEHGEVVGYFTGLIVKRFGVRILGSPFAGWATDYMGFNMVPGTSRVEGLKALETFAFRDLNCLHVEVSDRNLRREQGLENGFASVDDNWYESDLTPTEDEIFARMARTCKGNVGRAKRSGVVVEQAHDLQFASDYYQQLVEVFSRQHLVPTFAQDRIEKLIRHLLPTGHLLLLRARDPSGKCIATGIWVGMNKLASFWGNASLKSHQHLRPNQALHWYAMRYWKKQGMEFLAWGGGGYKEQYGGAPVVASRFMKSRFRMIQALRDGARRMMAWRQRTIGLLRSRSSSVESP